MKYLSNITVCICLALLFSSCSTDVTSVRNLRILDCSVSDVGGLNFNSGSVGTSAIFSVTVDNPTTATFTIEDFAADVILPNGSKLANAALKRGGAFKLDPKTVSTVEVPMDLSFYSLLSIWSTLGGSLGSGGIEQMLEKYKDCTVNIEATVCMGKLRKTLKKNGIPLDEMLSTLKPKTEV